MSPARAASGHRARGQIALVVLSLALFAGTRWYILTRLEPRYTDITHYLELAVRADDLGEAAFGPDLPIEFPPVAWWTIAAVHAGSPIRLGPGSSKLDVDEVSARFTWRFRVLMCVADAGAFVLFAGLVRRRGVRWLGGILLAYVAATASLGHALYDRFDAAFLLILMGWAAAWLRASSDGARATGWLIASYAIFGVGISYRLIPVVGLPFLLWCDLRRGPPRRALAALASLGLTAAGPFLIQYLISGPGVFGFLSYQGERGIQIESIYATVMAAGHLAGWPMEVCYLHGAHDVTGALAPALKVVSASVLAGVLIWLAVRAIRQPGYTRDDAYRFTCAAIVAATIASNVLSPQYFVWAIPLGLLLAVEVAGDAAPRGWVWTVAAALVVVAGITTWVSPYHYFVTPEVRHALVPQAPGQTLPPAAGAFVAVGLRNVLFLGIVVALVRRAVSR